MPMSKEFQDRLFPIARELAQHYDGACFVYDEIGIHQAVKNLQDAFAGVDGYQNFGAVKALPVQQIMKMLLHSECGFDCASPYELALARKVGAAPDDLMFSSNATTGEAFLAAADHGGCMINFDDFSLLEQAASVIDFPELFFARYNPGKRRRGTKIIGDPAKAKFGVPHNQIVDTFRLARDLGAKRNGIHTMIVSNMRRVSYLVQTAKMLLDVIDMVHGNLGIQFEFMNIGGGFGIPYKPREKVLDVLEVGRQIKKLLDEFKSVHGWVPRLITENGRYITGPHGTLLTTVVSHKHGAPYDHPEYVCVNTTTTAALPRAAIYDTYHHLSVVTERPRRFREVHVVGPLCEGNDFFSAPKDTPRRLAETEIGSVIAAHDCGAHVWAMRMVYNGYTSPPGVLLCEDGAIELVHPAETIEERLKYFNFQPEAWRPKA